MSEQFRHGDLLIERVDSLPYGAEPVDEDPHVLAYGEATGHAHRLSNGLVYESRRGGRTAFVVEEEEGADLTHEEHDTIHLDSGIYRITRQREFDPMDQNRGASTSWRYVAD